MNYVWSVLLILLVGAVLFLFFRRKWNDVSEIRETRTPSTGPYEVIAAGEGVTVFMPRSASVKMPSDIGHGVEHYKSAVRNLLANTFGMDAAGLVEQDKVWREWLDLKSEREPRDLVELLGSQVTDAFKARALTFLSLPALRFSPFEWKSNDSDDRNYRFMNGVELAVLPQKVQEFALGLVLINAYFVRESEPNEKLYETLFLCNKWIRDLMVILPENDPRAEDLFRRYELNDPVDWWNMEDASGYNPFAALMQAPISEKWKVLADTAMRARIQEEEAGVKTPRADWEDAFGCYRNHIKMLFYSRQPYSLELYASQINFMLECKAAQSSCIVDDYKVHDLLLQLGADTYKDLRRKLAHHLVLVDREEIHSFSVYNPESRAAALLMLEEFGGADQKLRVRLEHLLAKYEERERVNSQEQLSKENQKDAVLKKMA